MIFTRPQIVVLATIYLLSRCEKWEGTCEAPDGRFSGLHKFRWTHWATMMAARLKETRRERNRKINHFF